MAIINRDELFSSLGNVVDEQGVVSNGTAATWSAGVAFKRANPAPIEKYSLFKTLEEATRYAKMNPVAYPGQTVAILAETGNDASLYIIQQDGNLKEVGSTVTVDNATIALSDDGTLGLYGFVAAENGAQLVKGADGKLSWVKPDTTTVEGLTTTVNTLNATVNGTDGKSGLVGDVASLKTKIEDTYSKSEVDGLVAGAFHFKGTADKFEDGKLYNTVDGSDTLITGTNGDVYQVGTKEYAFDGTKWVELGFSCDLSGYYTKTDIDGKLTALESSVKADSESKANTAEENAKAYVDTQITNLGIGNYATTESVNSAVSAAKTELIGDKTGGATKDDDTIAGAKKYADEAVSKKVTANTGIEASGAKAKIVTYDEKGLVTSGKAIEETDLPTISQAKIEGLTGDLSAKQDKLTFNTAYDASTNKAATMSDIEAAKNALVGDAEADGTKDTIKDAKKYAESKASDALTSAKTYADGIKDTIKDEVSADVTANKTAIDNLNGDVSNSKSVAYKVKEAIDALDSTDTAVAKEFVTEVKQENGLITVSRKALVEDDIPTLQIGKVDGLQAAIDAKQDALGFEGTYNKTTNKVATSEWVKTQIEGATSGLTGAMHFVGTSTTDPSLEAGATVEGHTTFAAGDVCLFNKKEFVYNGTKWLELGDEGSHAIKGAITDADIAANAAIAQSKVSGLTTALDSKLEGVTIDGADLPITEKKVAIPMATASQLGLVKGSTAENKVKVNADGTMELNKVNANKLVQTAGEWIVLKGGTAASFKTTT